MEEEKDNTEEKWIESAGDLVGAYRDLAAIKIVEHASQGISISISGMLSLVTMVFVLMFAGFGTAWWIGGMMNNMIAGYFIVAGIYVLILILLTTTSKKIIIPSIRNMVIKKIYEQD